MALAWEDRCSPGLSPSQSGCSRKEKPSNCRYEALRRLPIDLVELQGNPDLGSGDVDAAPTSLGDGV